MTVEMSNFGEMLQSRPAGREAFLGASAYIFDKIDSSDSIVLDFKNVKILAPSWADEFVSGIKNKFSNKIEFLNTENPSVKASLSTITSPVDMSAFRRKII